MKNVLKSLYFVVLAATAFSATYAKPTKKYTSEDPFRHTKEKASLLDKITDYAYIIADTSDKKIGLAAKKELQSLIKKLESEIYDELHDNYHIIITNYPHDHVKVVKASHQLIEKIQAIKAKQQLVKTIDDATITVNAVSDELKPAVIAEQQKKIEMDEANAQQKGFLSKLKTKILGDEISWSKAAFYAAVGAATLAGLYYGYQYKYNIEEPTTTVQLPAATTKPVSGVTKPTITAQLSEITKDEQLDKFINNFIAAQPYAKALSKAFNRYQDNPTKLNELLLYNAGLKYGQVAEPNIAEYKSLSTEQQDKADEIMKKFFAELR